MRGLGNASAFAVSLAAVLAVASFGAQFGPGEWYRGLEKPSFNPPNWVFGPVWSLLYLGMAFAAWLVWMKRNEAAVALPLALYAAHLMLNGLWSWLFFGLHRTGLAFVEILVLEALIVIVLVLFWRVRPLAGALLIPYAAWVGFASVLNFAIWRLNAGAG